MTTLELDGTTLTSANIHQRLNTFLLQLQQQQQQQQQQSQHSQQSQSHESEVEVDTEAGRRGDTVVEDYYSFLQRQQEEQEHQQQDDDRRSSSSTSSNNDCFHELSLKNIDFDPDTSSKVIETIRSLPSSSSSSSDDDDRRRPRPRRSRKWKWKRISIVHCSGLVNDVILSCTSHVDLQGLYVNQPVINAQTSFCLLYGLKYNTRLRSLKLSIPLWDDPSNLSNVLAKALARNTTLQELSLEGCVIPRQRQQQQQQQQLQQQQTSTPATTTSNNNNDEGGGGNDDNDDDDDDDDDELVSPVVTNSVRNISFGLRLNSTLQSLSLNGCELTDEHCGMVLGALQGHSSLKKLEMQKNACWDEGMQGVAGLLLDSTELRELDLCFLIRPKAKKKKEKGKLPKEEKEEVDQNKDDKEAEETSKQGTEYGDGDRDKEAANDKDGDDKEKDTDKDNGEEKSDDSKDDDENDEDDEEQDEQKVTNSTLEVLKLGGNGLGDEYVESLLNIFVNKTKISNLQELNLFGNRLTNRGLKMILKKCKYLPNLQLLQLQHNVFLRPLAMKDDIMKFITTNYALHEFSIYNSLMTVAAGRQPDPGLQSLQDRFDYYGRLNRTGRRIMTSFAQADEKKKSTNDKSSGTKSNKNDSGGSIEDTEPSKNEIIDYGKKDVPLGLWTLILDRANRKESVTHAADIISYLLQYGPMVLDNPNIVS